MRLVDVSKTVRAGKHHAMISSSGRVNGREFTGDSAGQALGFLWGSCVLFGPIPVSLLRWRSGGSNTPTIRRLNPSRRHQLPRIPPYDSYMADIARMSWTAPSSQQ